jgi:hypothetical protein
MGLFEKIFRPRQPDVTGTFFKTLNAYMPVFTSRPGGVYEMELTRAAIHAFATHCSKLKPEVSGNAKLWLKTRLQYQPNPWMDTTKLLYRLATILETDTTAFLVPVTDEFGNPNGVFPILPSRTEITELGGEVWLRYTFSSGQIGAIEFTRVGVLTKFQRADDFFGSGNAALDPTLDLLDVQRQGMSEGVKTSAAIRFIGRLAQTLRPEDIKAERDRFAADNLAAENTSGLMLIDSKYADIKQIESKPWLIGADEMGQIQANVFDYFGVSEKILQNDFDEDAWNAYYEGKVEAFALQLSLVMTNMFFTERERAFGNEVTFSSNRLQYVSIPSKVAVTQNLVDRGLMSNWQACDLWNLPRPRDPDGTDVPERWVIRGEYIDTANLPTHTVDAARTYLQPGAPAPAEPTEGAQ